MKSTTRSVTRPCCALKLCHLRAVVSFREGIPHNQSLGFLEDESSVLVECINKVDMTFPGSRKPQGIAVTFGDGLCTRERHEFLGITRPRRNSNIDKGNESEEDSSGEDGDVSQSESQQSAAAALPENHYREQAESQKYYAKQCEDPKQK